MHVAKALDETALVYRRTEEEIEESVEYVHASDIVPTMDDLKNGFIIVYGEYSRTETDITSGIVFDGVYEFPPYDINSSIYDSCVNYENNDDGYQGIVYIDIPEYLDDPTYGSFQRPIAIVPTDNCTDGEYTFATKGIYFTWGVNIFRINNFSFNGGAAPIANGQYAITTAGDGSAYTATVPSITTLTAGASFIMIPHVVSATTTPTLNVNGLGAKNIKRRLSNLSTSLQNGYSNTWLAVGKPFRVTYDGTAWIVEGHEKPAAADMYGLSASITELNYCEGVTSNIQTQLNAKADSSDFSTEDWTFTLEDGSTITKKVVLA